MKLVYVLIIILTGGTDGGKEINRAAEFETERQCNTAKDIITDSNGDRRQIFSGYSPRAYCIKALPRTYKEN